MSRIGIKPISLPSGVTVNLDKGIVNVVGPKGQLSEPLKPGIDVAIESDRIIVTRKRFDGPTKALHGLMNRLIANMILGVTQGFEKKLELIGTGYRARMQGQSVVVLAGYSHPVEYKPPEGVTLACEGETIIKVTGIDKQAVGQVAANLRMIRPPEPYKGKGIRYQGEIVRRKAGKATKTGAAA